MLLEYEKEILEFTREQSSLTIAARGIAMDNVLAALLEACADTHSLVFIVNSSDTDRLFLAMLKTPVTDIAKLTISQRSERYRAGGIFCGSSRALVTDFINRHVEIDKVGAIVVMNSESIGPDSAESFICYLFREHSPLGLIRAFSSDPIRLHHASLESVAQSLCLSKILFYPRFHEKVAASMRELDAVQIYIKQSDVLVEAVLLAGDIMKSIMQNERKQGSGFDYMDVLIYPQANKDIRDFRTLVSLLFCSDSLTAYLFYKSMVDVQKRNEGGGSWIFTEPSHLLLDVLRSRLEKDINSSKIERAEFAFDLDAETFRGKQVAKRPRTALLDSVSESSISQEESGDSGTCMHESMGSSNLSGFYLANPKIRKAVEIIDRDPDARTAILVPGGCCRRSIENVLESLGGRGNVSVLTHSMMQGESGFDRFILLNPDLGTIRCIECISAVGTEAMTYILQYKDSVEEQRFLQEIREEKHAFETMIEERAKLPLRMDLGRLELEDDSDEDEYAITVDSREMRARLPFFLYRAGNHIDVKVIDAGDYLIGKNRCIERKTVGDFAGSINSGRLYQQAQRLVHQYRSPILLLEFDGCKPTLLDFESTDVFRNTLIAKLCLFLYSFPAFELLWSNNHVHTVRLIRDIQRRDSVQHCLSVSIDPVLKEILLCIPGISSLNAPGVMHEFRSLYDLAFAGRERLEKVLDNGSAEKVFEFFRQEFPSVRHS